MNPIVKTPVAIFSGLAVGSAVNMGLIILGTNLIPPPAGADTTTIDGLKASIHLFEAKHFLFPFLAHALGTFTGALTAALIYRERKVSMASYVAGFFLIGGISNIFILPSPLWFSAVDLIFAYLPMAWLAQKLRA